MAKLDPEELERLENSAEHTLLAGSTLAAAWDEFRETGLTKRRLTEIRDAVFGRLRASPDNVKALADGPLLNANAIVRYKHPRPRKVISPPAQLSILDIVDGHMGRTA